MNKVKSFLYCFMAILLVFSISSCQKTKFNEKDTENLYAQIVLKSIEIINLKLDYKNAPRTIDNFIDLVNSNFYDDTIFHSVINDFAIRAGGYYLKKDEPVYKKDDKEIVGEFKSNGFDNNISHKLGVISMAREKEYNSATSMFFICAANCDFLDGNYAAFGWTTDSSSEDIVLMIANVKTYEYNSVLKNLPVNPIIISKIRLSNKKF